MRPIHALLLVTVFSLAAQGEEKTLNEAPRGTALTLYVSGMDCNSCANMVVSEFKKLPGVTEAVADADKGTVVVTYLQEKVKEKTLLSALKERPKYKISKTPLEVKK